MISKTLPSRQHLALMTVREATLVCNCSTNLQAASAMFGQIDVLSLPGAGLRALDYSSDVNAMFADLFPSNNGSNTQGQMEPTSSPSNIPSQPMVRTYGSEQDM
jgi:hypothetical protein